MAALVAVSVALVATRGTDADDGEGTCTTSAETCRERVARNLGRPLLWPTDVRFVAASFDTTANVIHFEGREGRRLAIHVRRVETPSMGAKDAPRLFDSDPPQAAFDHDGLRYVLIPDRPPGSSNSDIADWLREVIAAMG